MITETTKQKINEYTTLVNYYTRQEINNHETKKEITKQLHTLEEEIDNDIHR